VGALDGDFRARDRSDRCAWPAHWPGRQHSIEEKRRIVEETHVRGASVATVARRHQVNANQVFAWRQLYRRGLLEVTSSEATSPMLPVKLGVGGARDFAEVEVRAGMEK
jgi:transposase-like protein